MKYLLLILMTCLACLINGCALVPSNNVNELNLIEGAGFDLTKANEKNESESDLAKVIKKKGTSSDLSKAKEQKGTESDLTKSNEQKKSGSYSLEVIEQKKESDPSNASVIRGTALFPVFRSTGHTEFNVLSAKGETIKKIRERLDSQVRHRLISGQLRLVTFSLDLAKKGIFPIIDTFNRDPAIGNVLQLAIVDGQTIDLLSLKRYKENLSLFIHDLLVHNSKTGPVPYTDFSTYVYQYFEEGQDPYLPVLKIVDDKIKINGIALFKKDKVVAIIPWKYVFIFKSLLEDYKQGLHQFKIDGEYVAIDNIKSENKYEIKMKKGKPEFTIYLKMNSRIQEYTGNEPTNLPKKIKQISKAIEKDLEKDGEDLFAFLQKNNVDPIGLGSKLEAHQRDFDLKKWRKDYPNVKVNFKVKLDILHTGIVE